MKRKNEKTTIEEIKSIIKEIALQLKETDKKIQETDRILTEKFQETDRKFQETDRKIQETDRILNEKFQETDRRFRETDKKLRQLEDLFVGQWGKLVEAMVEGKLKELLIERGILIQRTAQRETAVFNGDTIEIDIIAKNGDSIVAVEVKTSLKVSDVDHFVKKLSILTEAFPEYKGKKVFGAVAFIHSTENAQRYAYKKGLFVIKAVGDGAVILNDKKFKPKNYSHRVK